MGVCKPCIEKLYLWAIILEENALVSTKNFLVTSRLKIK